MYPMYLHRYSKSLHYRVFQIKGHEDGSLLSNNRSITSSLNFSSFYLLKEFRTRLKDSTLNVSPFKGDIVYFGICMSSKIAILTLSQTTSVFQQLRKKAGTGKDR